MAYDKRIVDYCNTNGVDLGIQNVFTPIAEIEKATGFSFINEVNSSTQEICILFNVEFFEYFIKQDYIKNNKIKLVFGYDCVIDKNVVLDLEPNTELIDLTGFSKTKNIEDFKTAMGNRKFDVVFSNPPYGTKGSVLDLYILQAIFPCANKIVFIHPSAFILDKKFKVSIYNEIRNTNYLEKTILFWGNKMFNIGLFTPLNISVWNTNKIDSNCQIIDTVFTSTNYNMNIYDIDIHGNNKSVKNFKKYILDKIKNTSSLFCKITPQNKLNDFSVKFPLIRTCVAVGVDGYGNGFYSLFSNEKDNMKCDHTYHVSEKSHVTCTPHWSFNNDIERDNFIQYCKTKVVRFLLSFVKISSTIGHFELDIIPWMDFTRSWTDKDLCKEFNISDELWQYIDKFIPDYYDDYKSGF